MVARPFRCDTRRLRLLLEDRLAEAEQTALAGHLERCDSCREALERLAGESRDWGDVRLLDHDPTGPTRDNDETLDAELIAGMALDFLDPPTDPAHLGRIGHYEVVQVIGRGGNGVVLKAIDPTLDRFVAIKVLAPGIAASATARKRFAREAKAAAAIAHEHIVAIHAVDSTRTGLPFLVMPFVSGRSLQERLERDGPLELKEILRIGKQAAEGLAAAHAVGLVHRDVKPANILLENCVERVKLSDFGLARAADDASLTQSGVVAGTPLYMSPEQARGEGVDARSDLFSLGSVLYALCTGRSPFRAETTMGILRRVSEETPRPIRQINPDIPDWLAAIVARLHAKDRNARFPTASEVADLLGRCLAYLEQPGQGPPPYAPKRKPMSKKQLALAAGVLVSLFAGLGAADAAGVANVGDFVASILRIQTKGGMLVVEVNDPGVTVRVDGDDLYLTGAGPESVRVCLDDGKHEVAVAKDGKAVLNKIVEIKRGEKTVVAVSREGTGTQERIVAADPTVAEELGRRYDSLVKKYQYLRSVTRQVDDDPTAAYVRKQAEDAKKEWDTAFEERNLSGVHPASNEDTIRQLEARIKQLEAERALAHDPAIIGLQKSLDAAQEARDRLRRVIVTPADPALRRAEARIKELEAILARTRTQKTPLSPDERRLSDWAIHKNPTPSTASMKLPCAVFGVVISPDLKTQAFALFDGKIKLNYGYHEQLGRELVGHTMPVRAIAFSPDGRRLASVSGDYRNRETPGELRLWDVASGRLVSETKGHKGMIWSVAFSPDGQVIATGAWDNTAKLWEADTLKPLATCEGHKDAVRSVAFSPDGKSLATGSFDGTVKFWHASPNMTVTGALWSSHNAFDDGVSCIAYSPDGKTMAISRRPSFTELRPDEILVIDLSTWKDKLRLRGHRNGVVSLAFSPDGRTLASGGGTFENPQQHGEVFLWDAVSGADVARFADLTTWIESVAFSPDGRLIFGGGGVRDESGEVLVWPVPKLRVRDNVIGITR